MRDYYSIYQEWLNSSLLSKEEKEELLAIKDNDNQITERFYRDLEFATGGLRGVMEVGTNRMNRFIIRRATQGLANYLNKKQKGASVAIAYDSRNHSDEFAKETASTLAANGVKVYLYKELMPTPSLSFAVRYFKCDAGVVVTASHNPKIYNGYKVYGPDGCQCTDNLANAVLEEILAIDMFNDVKVGDFDKLVKEIREGFYKDVYQVNGDYVEKVERDEKRIYYVVPKEKVKTLAKDTRVIARNGTYREVKEIGYVLVDDFEIEKPKILTVRKFQTEDHQKEAEDIIKSRTRKFREEEE